MRIVKAVVVGSSRLSRERITRQLAAISGDVVIVAETPASAAAAAVRRTSPDLVVLLDGTTDEHVEALRAASSRPPRVVVVPMDAPERPVAGAIAVLPRSGSTNRAIAAVLGRVVARI